MHKKYILVCILLVVSSFVLFPQDEQPRVAVLRFSPIGVSDSDASVVTDLFETGLVKTGRFNVIEQKQIEAILDVQEQSLSGCSDESCAIEIGKLLSSEQIVLGSLSFLDGNYILNVKLIDVALGKNLKAEKVVASSLGDMIEKSELLAFAIAGLTMKGSESFQVVESFCDIFIETEPEGAEIFVNGTLLGTSPDLITNIPAGEVTIEARKDNLYVRQVVDTSAGMEKLLLTLDIVRGNLFISASEKNAEVFLDGESLGPLGKGFFEGLPSGKHFLELKVPDAYTGLEIDIPANESLKVEAALCPFGSLEYDIPDGARAILRGTNYERALENSGEIEALNVGTYTVTVTGEIYEPFEGSIAIERGTVSELKPDLSYTDAYVQRKNIEESILALREEKSGLEDELKKMTSRRTLRSVAKWGSLGSGAGSLIASVVFFSLGTQAYRDYTVAGADEWEIYKARYEEMDLTAWLLLGSGLVLSGTGSALWFTEPKAAEQETRTTGIHEKILELDLEIARLEEGLK